MSRPVTHPVVNGKKTCIVCERHLPTSEFYRNREATGFKPRCRECYLVTAKESRKARPEAVRAIHRKKTYGLLPEDYEAMVTFQEGRCAICRRKPRYPLHVDHDNRNGLIRGGLCKVCNGRLLPAARDKIATLEAAIQYLTAPPAVAVLGERFAPEGQVNRPRRSGRWRR